MEKTHMKKYSKIFMALVFAVACFITTMVFMPGLKNDVASAEEQTSTPIIVKVLASYISDSGETLFDSTLLTNNMGCDIDNIVVDSNTVFSDTKNVVANDRESDKLEFVGYFIKSRTGSETNVSNGRQIKTLTFDEDFVRNYVNEGVLEVVAKYSYKRKINIVVDESCKDFGSFDIILKDKNNNLIEYNKDSYYSVGTKVSVLPNANKYYEFEKFEFDGETYYENNITVSVEDGDINIVVFFKQELYSLNFNIVNTLGDRLGNEKIDILLQSSENNNNPVVNCVVLGDVITEISLNTTSYHNYRFVGWEILDKDNSKVPLASRERSNLIGNIEITKSFVDQYVIDGKIEFYAVFVQNCQLSIIMQDSYISEKTFKVYCNGEEVLDLSKPFDYGTELTVSVDSIEHMNFVGFDGLIDSDTYTNGQSTAFIKMNGNRNLALKYEYKNVELSVSKESSVKHGSLSLNQSSVKIGDTLIVNANLNGSFKIKSFEINGDSAEQFVSELNSVAGENVAVLGENGILTIYVNKNIFEYFEKNSVLNVNVDSKADLLYIILFIIYFLLTVGFGVVVIIFSVLATKKYSQVKQIRKKQYEAIVAKEKQQKEMEELALKEFESEKVETASVENKKTIESTAKEKVADEKPLTTQKTKTQAGAKKSSVGTTKKKTSSTTSAKKSATSKNVSAGGANKAVKTTSVSGAKKSTANNTSAKKKTSTTKTAGTGVKTTKAKSVKTIKEGGEN